MFPTGQEQQKDKSNVFLRVFEVNFSHLTKETNPDLQARFLHLSNENNSILVEKNALP
jgi:hypothetical protein